MSDATERPPTYMGYICDARDVEVTFEALEVDETDTVRIVFRTYTGAFELRIADRALSALAARVIVQLAGLDQAPR